MIIWSGHGYLVAVFVFGISLLMELSTESVFNDDDFYQREAWPFPLAMVIAAALCFLVGSWLKGADERRLIDAYLRIRATTSMTDAEKRARVTRKYLRRGIISDRRGSFKRHATA